jgi:hypothetical protein
MLRYTQLWNLKLDAKKDGGDAGGAGSAEDKKKADDAAAAKPAADAAGAQGDSGDDQLDVDKLPESAKKLIKSLRDENAKHRTKNKELGEGQGKLKKALVEAGIIEDDEVAPEEKVAGLSQQLQGAQMRTALLEAALEHSVPKESLKYFQFLVAERLEALEDDGELSQDDIAEIAQEAIGKGGAGKAASGGNSSVKGSKAPPAGGDSRVTVDQFDAMTILEKSDLYTKKPEVYQQLFTESKAKKARR